MLNGCCEWLACYPLLSFEGPRASFFPPSRAPVPYWELNFVSWLDWVIPIQLYFQKIDIVLLFIIYINLLE
jgi:hypothetical protein